MILTEVFRQNDPVFIKMLHQTAFGEARTDVPYFDLRPKEVFSISVLLLAAAYSGIIL